MTAHPRSLDCFVPGAHGVWPKGARLDLAPGFDGRHGKLGRDLDYVLFDHAPLGRGEEAVFEAGRDLAIDEGDAFDLARVHCDRTQEVQLLIDGD